MLLLYSCVDATAVILACSKQGQGQAKAGGGERDRGMYRASCLIAVFCVRGTIHVKAYPSDFRSCFGGDWCDGVMVHQVAGLG